MMNKGHYRYTIEQRDVDFMNKVTHVAFINYMLQAAGDDADKNGFGISDLNCGNCSWVLSRMCVEFLRRPANNEEITIITWVNDIGRLMTTRNMIVTDSNDVVIANAITQWAVIDLEKRVAVDIRENVNYGDAFNEDVSPIDKPSRVHRPESRAGFVKTVSYSDMDFNRHMNAMKYLEWMIDVLPIKYMSDRELRRVDLNFLHEARYGQELKMAFDDDAVSAFEITNKEDLPLCRASITWEEKK